MYYNPTAGSFTYNSNNYDYTATLEMKDGLKYYFNTNGDLIAIRNRFEDAIVFTYTTFNNQQVIDYITDASERVIDFTYNHHQSHRYLR